MVNNIIFKLLTVIAMLSVSEGIDHCQLHQYHKSKNSTNMQLTKEAVSQEYAVIGAFKSLHCCAKGYLEWIVLSGCQNSIELTGLAILCVGAIIQSSYHHYSTFVGASFWSAPILMIIVGAIVFIIAFLGCCGALKENSCMVLTFCILLVVIFLCELGIGIAGYVKHGQLEGILETGFNTTMTDYFKNEEAVDLVQKEMHCCGIKGPPTADYYTVFKNYTLPNSCCTKFPQNSNVCTQQNAIQDGCTPKLLHFLEEKSLILAGVGIGVALIQLIGVCYACCLYRAFRRNYETI